MKIKTRYCDIFHLGDFPAPTYSTICGGIRIERKLVFKATGFTLWYATIIRPGKGFLARLKRDDGKSHVIDCGDSDRIVIETYTMNATPTVAN